MIALWMGLAMVAGASEIEHDLSWDLQVGGNSVGHRDVTVKYVQGDQGMRRIIESWTEIDGAVGPIRLVYRQRMTAHATGREPASFHSVLEQNGQGQEVQARWTPSGWWVTTHSGGRHRTLEVPLNRIDISTADLMDPDSQVPLGRFQEVRILSAETGEVLTGPVEDLGLRDLSIGGETVQAHGYGWDAPVGKAVFWFSADGFLVEYDMALLGIQMKAVMKQPPPPGIDDFPVYVGAPEIEEIQL